MSEETGVKTAQAQNTAKDAAKRPQWGLALGGGAGMGWAHIGILKAFVEDMDMPPQIVSGTSIGAIVGGAYACGRLKEVEEFARELGLKDMLMFGQMAFGRGGLLGTTRIENIMRKHVGQALIEALPIRFACVAADLMTGQAISLEHGSLVTAMKASSAIPGLFPAVSHQGRWLIDGGSVSPVPVEAARKLGADKVIAINLQNDFAGSLVRLNLSRENQPGVVKTARAALLLTLRALAHDNLIAHPADMVIAPEVGRYDPVDFTKADELIEIGRSAVLDKKREIMRLLKPR